MNLRNEFNRNYILVNSVEFEEKGKTLGPIESPYFVWHGMPAGFYTIIAQRAILGIEAYLPDAVHLEALKRGVRFNFSGDVFSLGSKSLPDNLFNRLPAKADPKFKMARCDNQLWKDALFFYSEVRNPLFHGNEFDEPFLESVREVYDFVARVYEWIDSWHDLDSILPGSGVFAGIREKFRRHGTGLKSVRIDMAGGGIVGEG